MTGVGMHRCSRPSGTVLVFEPEAHQISPEIPSQILDIGSHDKYGVHVCCVFTRDIEMQYKIRNGLDVKLYSLPLPRKRGQQM